MCVCLCFCCVAVTRDWQNADKNWKQKKKNYFMSHRMVPFTILLGWWNWNYLAFSKYANCHCRHGTHGSHAISVCYKTDRPNHQQPTHTALVSNRLHMMIDDQNISRNVHYSREIRKVCLTVYMHTYNTLAHSHTSIVAIPCHDLLCNRPCLMSTRLHVCILFNSLCKRSNTKS